MKIAEERGKMKGKLKVERGRQAQNGKIRPKSA
jgi:hypothetical protein